MNVAKTRIWVVPLVVILLLFLEIPARSAVLASYTAGVASTGQDANSTPGDIGVGSGIGQWNLAGNGGNPPPSLNISSSGTGASFDATDYFGFTVTPKIGYVFNLSGS